MNTDFTGLDLIEPLSRAVATEGYTTPTPIQARTIPALLSGSDVLGIAQTGTGKTAAFTLPLLQRLSADGTRAQPGRPRALILAPTRELAAQIGDSLTTYGRHLVLRSLVVFGGVPISRQVKALTRPVDVVVATPGRLLDLVNQRRLFLDRVEIFVLDEADRMLDLGFVNDVRKIAKLVPARRQTVMFSATMPKTVEALADGLLRDPVRAEVAPRSTPVERIAQSVMFVTKANKRNLLAKLLADRALSRVLVFTRTKHGADRVAKHLEQIGIHVGVIHGNKNQNARERALAGFSSGRVRILIATDIAARGIDVDGISHVVNFDLPNDAENYVHRIGRTARAGADGAAISFCDADEVAYLKSIEKLVRRELSVDESHAYHENHRPAARLVEKTARPGAKRRRRGARGGKRPERLAA